jgi:hypothetical protein
VQARGRPDCLELRIAAADICHMHDVAVDGVGSRSEQVDAPMESAITKVPRRRGGEQLNAASSADPCTFRRIAVWFVVAISTGAVLLATSTPATALIICVLLTALAATALVPGTGPERVSITALIPAGFAGLVAWALIWGLASGIAGLGGWSGRPGAVGGVAAFLAITGLVSHRRGGDVVPVGRDWPAAAVAASLMAFVVAVVVVQPFAWWSRINGAGTDFLRHLSAVRLTTDTGFLVPGEAGYPQALHALGAWLVVAVGLPTDAETLWRTVSLISFLMVAIVLLGIATMATKLVDAMLGVRAWGALAALLTALVFVQTAWLSSFLSMGNLMNMLVGVCLVSAMLAALSPALRATPANSVISAVAISVTANAWQLLLPVTCAVALPSFVEFLRSRRTSPLDWIAWGSGLILTVNGVMRLLNLEAGEQASVATVSGLFRPDWWWWVALALAVASIVWTYRIGLRAWSVAAALFVGSSIGVVALLLIWTGSTWDLMLYYPVKALWTCAALLIPLSVSAVIGLFAATWHMSTPWPALRTVARGASMLVLGLLVAGVVGRGASVAPHLVSIAEGRAGLPNWAMSVVDSMRGVPILERQEPGAMVFGLAPSAQEQQSQTIGFSGVVDYMGMEALTHLGVQGSSEVGVKEALVRRDMDELCRYLRVFPGSLRITGPSPATGPQRIIDAGCPEETVQLDAWIRLDIDPVWFERSPWEAVDSAVR